MSLLKHSVRAALALSVAAAGVHPASALDISTYASSSPVNVYLTGSTAVDNSILNASIAVTAPGGLCAANTIDVYFIGTSSSYTNRMIFCSASGNITGVTAGTPLAIFKESNVGSANGVAPLYLTAEGKANGLSFIDPSKITDSNCTTETAVAATANFSAYNVHDKCPAADVVNANPTAGFADVEAAILRTPANGPVDATATSTYLTAVGTVDQIWSVLLTKNAYYAVQAAEGYTSPSDLATNAPSLSKEQVASLLASGDIVAWSQLGVSSPADDNVYLCRRDYGSGTEASFESQFLGERCSISSETIPPEDGQYVFAAGSASGVRGCLQAFFAGGSITPYYGGSAVTEPGSQFAIGINNSDITAGNLSGNGDAFRAIAVDGSGPTVENVQNGVYPYFSTGVAYTITKGTGIPSGLQDNVRATLLARIGHPNFESISNANNQGLLPWATTSTVGDAAPANQYLSTNPLSAVPSTAAIAKGNPTNMYYKGLSTKINNCDTPVFDVNDAAVHSLHTTAEKQVLGNTDVNN
jgi:hypothetical protein